jgi:purine-nucleoside phosphorylase
MTADFATLSAACRAAPPEVAVVLGSGMGPVAARVQGTLSVPFAALPGLSAASVPGHRGCFTLGHWGDRRVLLLEGRLHYYEGHPWEVVVRPLQTAAALGARTALLTNAAGGIAAELGPGRLMALRDHLEWTSPDSWRRSAPVSGILSASPYSERLRGLLRQAAGSAGVDLSEGVYAAVTGPCYETPAEIRALRAWGADAVGMSTAREVRASQAAGMECAAISLITNHAAGTTEAPLDHREVLAMAQATATRLADLIEGFLGLL